MARAARTKGNLMLLSGVATTSVEDAIAARSAPVWHQLYPTNVREVCRAMIKRAESACAPAIVLTVDLHDGSNRETLFRNQRADKRQCSMCHGGFSLFARGKPGTSGSKGGFADFAARKPTFNGLDVSSVKQLYHCLMAPTAASR